MSGGRGGGGPWAHLQPAAQPEKAPKEGHALAEDAGAGKDRPAIRGGLSRVLHLLRRGQLQSTKVGQQDSQEQVQNHEVAYDDDNDKEHAPKPAAGPPAVVGYAVPALERQHLSCTHSDAETLQHLLWGRSITHAAHIYGKHGHLKDGECSVAQAVEVAARHNGQTGPGMRQGQVQPCNSRRRQRQRRDKVQYTHAPEARAVLTKHCNFSPYRPTRRLHPSPPPPPPTPVSKRNT
jgi:hypothetical protein